MPLSKTIERKMVHTRNVTCKGYMRDDGLLDIEGHLQDIKPFDFPNKDRGGVIKAGEALHGLSIRITIDRNLTIVDAEASMDDTPYNFCKSISPVFKQLIGIQIGPGWRNKIRDVMGGTKGCTHLTELLWPVATTAFQTLVSLDGPDEDNSIKDIQQKHSPKFINTCHSLAENSPVVKEHWTENFRDDAEKPA